MFQALTVFDVYDLSPECWRGRNGMSGGEKLSSSIRNQFPGGAF